MTLHDKESEATGSYCHIFVSDRSIITLQIARKRADSGGKWRKGSIPECIRSERDVQQRGKREKKRMRENTGSRERGEDRLGKKESK